MKNRSFGVEYHCHNVDSNGNLGSSRTIVDSPQTYQQMLDSALAKKIDVIFVSNHNFHSVERMLEYKSNHSKYDGIRVYPGVEVSCSYTRPDGRYVKSAHLIGLGVKSEKSYRIGDSPGAAAEKLKSDGAVVIAPHTYGVTSSLMKEGLDMCERNVDVIEAFNSNNLDIYSNTRAFWDAVVLGKPVSAGSDAHMDSTMGRCRIEMAGEKDMDSVLHNFEKGMFEITRADYMTLEETADLYYHQLSRPEKILQSLGETRGERVSGIVGKLVRGYRWSRENSVMRPVSNSVVGLLGGTLIGRTRNISLKMNVYDYPSSILYEPVVEQIRESFRPLDKSKFGPNRVDLGYFPDEKSPEVTVDMMNAHNRTVRTEVIDVEKKVRTNA